MIDPANIPNLKKKPSNDVCVKSLLNITPLDYKPKALQVVNIGPYGAGVGHHEFTRDGEQAYQQTVAYLVTGNEQYASNAAFILDSWAKTCKVFTGSNAPLEAGWGTASMAKAAELLKYTWSAKWNASGVEQRYVAFVNKLMLPVLTKPLGWDDANNWGLTRCEARLQIAILKNDVGEFNGRLDEYRRILPRYVQANGQTGELARDLVHAQFGTGSLIQIAEIAWHQGVDIYNLYNNRMWTTLELVAAVLQGYVPPNLKPSDIKEPWFLPCGWDIGYNHYNRRKKLPMPKVASLMSKKRPEKYTFHWGLGSLTHWNGRP